jgi:undecaprenyl-diphosphatase
MDREKLTVLCLMAAFICVLIFARFGYLEAFDSAILSHPRVLDDPQSLRGGAKFAQAVSDFTALGGLTVLFLITAVTAGYFLIVGKSNLAFVIVSTVVSGWMVSATIKLLVGRTRPEIVPHLVAVHDASFPSGHALVSAVTYLTLGTLLASIQKSKLASRYILSVAVALTLLVGSSRIFLGVHFPTDVIAGWLLGAAWAMICLAIARRFILR